MDTGFTAEQINNIVATLSAARMATFEAARGFSDGTRAIEKYRWHALTSAAFFVSLHLCEVSMRNAVDMALAATYGPDWPWNASFERSLPGPGGVHFHPKHELIRARSRMPHGATGKVVAELRFAFWCHLFTSRYQGRIWDAHLLRCFPHLPSPCLPERARRLIHSELEALRMFRNRIAHHEPILAEPLLQRQQGIQSLLQWRNADLACWHASWETVSGQLTSRP